MLFVIIIVLLATTFYLLNLKRKKDEVWTDIFKNIENIKYIGQRGGYNIFELKTIRYNFDILYRSGYLLKSEEDLKILNKDTGKFLKISKNSWNITPYLKLR